MSCKLLLAVLFLSAISLSAGTMIFQGNDPFPGTSCPDPSCDVIGLGSNFDIKSLTAWVSNSITSQVAIDLNFGNSSTLSPFADFGVNIAAGDVLFGVNGILMYGLALTTHGAGINPGAPNGGTIVAGDLYKINNANGTINAQQALGDPGLIYRNTQPVQLFDDGMGSVTDVSAGGTVSISDLGDGTTDGRSLIVADFASTPALYLLANQMGFFAEYSPTCANDIVQTATVPEPSSLTMLGAGLLLFGLRFVRRS